jgi:hypothetical protein
VKHFFFFMVFFFALCLRGEAFPSEEQLRSKLHEGLTPNEVVALFGEPNNGRLDPCLNCAFTYIPPIGSLTVEKNGYTGVSIRFRDGKVSDWHIYSGNPSYAEPKAPPAFRFFLWMFGIIFALGIAAKRIIRATPVAAVVSNEVAKAFEGREIHTDALPAEFRFITHETTLQEVIDKLGKPSHTAKIPISAESGLGYALVSTATSDAAIMTFEYELPYHAAVIVMPEFPFQMENRIRAVFYRPIQQELAEATD